MAIEDGGNENNLFATEEEKKSRAIFVNCYVCKIALPARVRNPDYIRNPVPEQMMVPEKY